MSEESETSIDVSKINVSTEGVVYYYLTSDGTYDPYPKDIAKLFDDNIKAAKLLFEFPRNRFNMVYGYDLNNYVESLYNGVKRDNNFVKETKIIKYIQGKVFDKPPSLKQGIRRPCCEEHLKNLNFQEGDEAQLVCVITNALKERVKWFKDGNIVITDNERILIETNDDGKQILSIRNLTTADEGLYKCQIDEISTSAQLIVQKRDKKPKIKRPLEDISAKEGEDAVLTCVIENCSKLLVQWFKDENILMSDNERYQMTENDGNQTLTISNLAWNDSGTYKCSVGNCSTSATLIVEQKVKPYESQDLSPTSSEYVKVMKAFFETVDRTQHTIIRIQHIENESLRDQYEFIKEEVVTRNPNLTAIEKLLWHGLAVKRTKFGYHPINSINTKGFNRSYSGLSNGAVYGDGVYFATNAKTALKYAGPDEDGHCHMYYCKVLTGDSTNGRAGLKEAPYKSNGDVYDSVVDNIKAPSMFVILRDNQAFPEYLITFQ